VKKQKAQQIDGRRINIFYFSNEMTEKNNFLLWYTEITKQMSEDELEPTHLGLHSELTPNAYFRTKKRVETRYLEIINDEYEKVKSLAIVSVDPEQGGKEPAIMNYIDVGLVINHFDGTTEENKWCAYVSIDHSIRNKIHLKKYTEIFRKYVPWKEEHCFKSGKEYVNINYIRARLNKNQLKEEISRKNIKTLKIRRNGDSRA